MTSLAMRPTAKVDGTDGGRGGPFSCYPVSPWGVREQATSIRGGGVTLDQLASQVQRGTIVGPGGRQPVPAADSLTSTGHPSARESTT